MSDIVWKDEHDYLRRTGQLPPLDRVQALADRAVKDMKGERVMAVDYALDAPPVAVVATKLPDGGFSVEVEHSAEGISKVVEEMVRAQMLKQHQRNEEFLKHLFRLSDREHAMITSLQALTNATYIHHGGRGFGKKLRGEIIERIRKQMEEGPLPVNFWQTVEAHRMLEDEEGRRLVQAIIDRKVGCNGTATDR